MDIQYNKTDSVVLPITNTRIAASEYNQIAGSLMHIVNTSGLTPDSSDNGQLLEGLKQILADTDLSNVNNTGKSTSAGWAFPSTTWVDLTLGASGAQYTAPANGYFILYISQLSTAGYVNGINQDSKYQLESRVTMQGVGVSSVIPARAGERVNFYYDAIGTVIFRFIYAEGSKSEAN